MKTAAAPRSPTSGVVVLGAVLLAMLVSWRFLDETLGFLSSAVAVLTAWILGIGGWLPPAKTARNLLGVAALVVLFAVIPKVWPCDVQCRGGELYANLYGVSILWLALLLYLAATVLAALDVRHDEFRWPTRLLLWCALGSSGYYLWLAFDLKLVCPHCFAVHTLIVATVGVLLRDALTTLVFGLVAVGVGFGLHAGYAASLGSTGEPLASLQNAPADSSATADIPDPSQDPGQRPAASMPPLPQPLAELLQIPDAQWRATPWDPAAVPADLSELNEADRLVYEHADQGRRLGRRNSLLELEFVQSFGCEDCTELSAPLVAMLKGPARRGQVELIFRHSVPRDVPARLEMARLGFAAAACGHYEVFKKNAYAAQAGHALSLSAPTAEAQWNRLAEELDLEPYVRLLTRHPLPLNWLLVRDGERIDELGATGVTPQLLLLERSSGEVLKHWVGEVRPFAVQNAVRAAINERGG